MARKQTPQPLAIPSSTSDDTSADGQIDPPPLSSLSVKTPRTPRSPFRFSSKLGHSFSGHSSIQVPGQQQESQASRRPSTSPNPDVVSVGSQIYSPEGQGPRPEFRDREKLGGSPSKTSFFSNYKGSKSSNRLQPTDTIRHVTEERTSKDTDRPAMASQVSASELVRNENGNDSKSIVRRPVGGSAKPSDSPNLSTSEQFRTSPSSSSSHSNATTNPKKNKTKPFGILHRSKSISKGSDRDGHGPPESGPTNISEAERAQAHIGMRTAPVRQEYDRSHREMLNSSASRNRSADRQPPNKGNGDNIREHGRSQTTLSSSSKNENGGFLSGLKNSASKGGGFGSRLFGKVGRSYSANEKDAPIDDEHYTVKVINLPLIEQTRITRIAKRLEESRDKTEFWMPAFPWRAIDYLNYRGTETEGLYRVPGSGPQIKKWQRRFDQEYDIDLFEQEDLYDINIIGSMLKAWLRELPDELLPKSIQDRVSKECSGQEEVPQLLIDELSNLKPYNYYLLFAITCHLSLLLAHSEKNKMDFRNLCICFQPCMKIDAQCFKYLVVDWSKCWKGCKTEDHWLDQEYQVFDQVPPSSGEGRSSIAVESHDGETRNMSSSDSSQPPSNGVPEAEKKTMIHSTSAVTNSSGISTDTETTTHDAVLTPKILEPVQLQPLSPIQPLSPMQF